jgi:hypothetical protein
MFSCRHIDTGVLSLTPLKPRLQPPCAEPLPVQVEEGLAEATVVEESGAPLPPVTAIVIEEGRTMTEMTAPKRHWSHQSGPAQATQMW